jgi:hypothetical protein
MADFRERAQRAKNDVERRILLWQVGWCTDSKSQVVHNELGGGWRGDAVSRLTIYEGHTPCWYTL